MRQVEPDRLDPAKLAPFPKPLDINNDILVPQFSDKWMMELKAALGSRFQFEVLEEADPTLDQIFEWYEDTGYSNEQLTTFYDATINRRHEKRRLATLNLLAAVKDDSLRTESGGGPVCPSDRAGPLSSGWAVLKASRARARAHPLCPRAT